MKMLHLVCASIFVGGSIYAGGCGTAAANSEAGTRVYAYDTSGSAKDVHEQFFNRGLQDMMSGDGRARLVVYRFDVLPQEAYQGDAFGNDEEAAVLLKGTFDRSAGAKGTNLLKLFQEIDRRVPEWSKPVSIRIYTDCGTELMSPGEFKEMRALTEKWKKAGTLPDISFVGVDTGYRETLRDHIAFPVTIE
jgi:hypothetical protein